MSAPDAQAEREYAAALCRRNNLAVRDAAGLAPEAGDCELDLNELALLEAMAELRETRRGEAGE